MPSATLKQVFYAAALICFVLGAFGVPSRVGWVPAGLAFVTATLFF